MNGGSVVSGTSLGTLGGTKIVATGDYNGDGTSDIVTQSATGALTEFSVVNNLLVAGYSLGNPGTAWHAVTPELPGGIITSTTVGLAARPEFATTDAVAAPASSGLVPTDDALQALAAAGPGPAPMDSPATLVWDPAPASADAGAGLSPDDPATMVAPVTVESRPV